VAKYGHAGLGLFIVIIIFKDIRGPVDRQNLPRDIRSDTVEPGYRYVP
jgi:hypothetical protein